MSSYENTVFTDMPILGQNPFKRRTWKAWNRTGIALVPNNIYAFDFGQITTADTANSKGIALPAVSTFKWGGFDASDPAAQASVWHNVVKVASNGFTPNLQKSRVCCVALEANADNELGEMLVIGEIAVPIIGTASQAYTTGWGIRPTGGQFYATYFEYLATAADANTAALQASIYGVKQIGFTLAAKTEAGTPAATSVNCFFNGFGL